MASLFGLGDPSVAELQHAAEALVKSGPVSMLSAKAYFLILPKKSWSDAAVALLNQGVAAPVVYGGLKLASEAKAIPWKTIIGVATAASAAVSGFHGARRNKSVGWGAWWFMMGLVFPIFTPVIGIAQGYARPKEK